jgi:23S rRNA (cytosine1962-C5)-methyltransferase
LTAAHDEVRAAPTVRVNRKAAMRVQSGHPWIFSSDILDRGGAHPGDAVRVVDPGGKNLGTAHYSSTSQITLRLLTNRIEPIDRNFLRHRMEQAEAYRRSVVRDSEAYRLIHAEGDLLPGLIIDRYGAYFVLQLLDQGMDKLAPEIVATLADLFAPAGIVARNDVSTRGKENLPLETKVLAGQVQERVIVQMNGFEWYADLLEGQKTGVFLDQRENYLAIARYARGRALDCFTATGGFALHLARACESVDAADSSVPTLDIAKANAQANGIGNIDFHAADVLDLLPNLVSARRQYDIVVVDPPAFAKSRSGLESAARGYKEINLRALRLLQPGGILVSCSCSHHMTEAQLLGIIAAAALDTGKQLRVLERRTQSQDHPILLTVPETHYLKCLVLQVM